MNHPALTLNRYQNVTVASRLVNRVFQPRQAAQLAANLQGSVEKIDQLGISRTA